MQNRDHTRINRRTFLKTTAAAATVAASPLFGAGSSTEEEYKALVCILLEGGADTLGMVMPGEKRTLSISGSGYRLHPAMQWMQKMQQMKDLAVVANVGTLNEPVSRSRLESSVSSLDLPDQLFNQLAQREAWMMAGSRESGWAARVADSLSGRHINISVGGQNSMQYGAREEPLVAADPHFGTLNDPQGILHRLERVDIGVAHDAEAHGSSLGEQLELVASLMAARKSAGFAKRQIFFVRHDNWHTEGLSVEQMAQKDARNLSYLDHALGRFSEALAALGLHEKVTTFTTGDLNRGITSDGYGCSRGWGGHAFVMGGAVRAGLYGRMPDMRSDSTDRMPNGAVIPTIASDQYLATLVEWLGDGEIDLDMVFPNLVRFEQKTLGFMV